jgi:hypothetical protein
MNASKGLHHLDKKQLLQYLSLLSWASGVTAAATGSNSVPLLGVGASPISLTIIF